MGVGFLSKGILILGIFGLTAVCLPVIFRSWRHVRYQKFLLLSFVYAAPWLFLWPLALYLRSYDLFMDWFWVNNIGRYLGFAVESLGAPHTEGFWRTTLPWFCFPAFPYALWTIWRLRSEAWRKEVTQVCMLIAGWMLFLLWRAASARDNYALPLLMPLAVLAAPSVRAVPELLDRFADCFARVFFSVLISGIWYVWSSMCLSQDVPNWPFLLRVLPENFSLQFSLFDVIVATLATIGFVLVCWYSTNKQGRALYSWAAGLFATWVLLCQLFLPWIDYAKTYRGVFSDLETALPRQYDCVASEGLGESERAMLRYFLQITTARAETEPQKHCQGFIGEWFD